MGTIINKVGINPTMSIITPKVNSLNTWIKKKKAELEQYIKKKKDPITYCLWETHSKYKHTGRFKVKGWRKIGHANSWQPG